MKIERANPEDFEHYGIDMIPKMYNDTMDRILNIYRFSSNIIVVAVKGYLGTDWAAYIGVIKYSHEKESPMVALNGTKISHEIAKIMFPDVENNYIWRK